MEASSAHADRRSKRWPEGRIVFSNDCDPCQLFAPGPRQSIDQVAVTDHRVVAVIYDNVRGGLASFIDRGEWGWKSEPCR
jgi:prolyl oligopeptidase